MCSAKISETKPISRSQRRNMKAWSVIASPIVAPTLTWCSTGLLILLGHFLEKSGKLLPMPYHHLETSYDRWPGVVTVSYTHLRAHETRHDIVCRLLLEKKKIKK